MSTTTNTPTVCHVPPGRTPSQALIIWLKEMNPLIPDREMLRLLEIRESDSGLLARIRNGQRDLTVEQADKVMTFCRQHHGKKVRVRPAYKKHMEKLVFIGKPRLGQHPMAQKNATRKAAESKVKRLSDALVKLRCDLNLVRDAVRCLSKNHPEIDFLTRVPGAEEGELQPLPFHSVIDHDGKPRRQCDHKSIRLVGVPFFAEVDNLLIPLVTKWESDLLAAAKTESVHTPVAPGGALERLRQRVRAREGAEGIKHP